MNSTSFFFQRAQLNPTGMAILIPGQPAISFAELSSLSAKMQKLFLQNKIEPGQKVILLAPLTPQLYAAIIALLSLGVTILLIEPWMKLDKIKNLIKSTQPISFIYSGWLPWAWGMRSSPIRKIKNWVSLKQSQSITSNASEYIQENVSDDVPGIITFTTGSTGAPKGVVRTQGYLLNQYQVFSKNLELEKFQGTDLCIFANFVLANLTAGRGSVVIPANWKPQYFKLLNDLPTNIQPQTLTCGPAFVIELLKHQTSLPTLKTLHLGGAQIDNWIFESALQKWPDAHISHIYGSSEVEPVALTDATIALTKSKNKNLFQTLYVGHPVPEIQSQITSDTVWVSGPHVCPEYWGGPLSRENLENKKRINDQVWHNMGDRITEDDGWWFTGRSQFQLDNFNLEQKIYNAIQRSDSFIFETLDQKKILLGQNLAVHKNEIQKKFPEIYSIHEIKIYRDARHRARIDRQKSISKGVPWLLGSNT